MNSIIVRSIALALSPTAAHASDLMPAPPADIQRAYSHEHLASSISTRALAVSPGGRRAAYVVQVPVENEAADTQIFLPSGAPRHVAEGARINILDLRTKESARICPSSGNDWYPAWSPDGAYLAFYSDRDGEGRLWVYDVSARSCRRVTDRPVKSMMWAHGEPRWSPDGLRIYFAAWPAMGPGSPEQARAPIAPNTAPEMQPGEVAVYRHDPASLPAEGTGSNDDFETRCRVTGYSAASIAAASLNGGQTQLLVDADVRSAAGAPARHYPSSYFRLSSSGRWLSYVATSCPLPGQPNRRTTSLFVVDTRGGPPILVADDLRPAVGGEEFLLTYRWSPTADELVYARDGSLWRVQLSDDGPGSPQRLAEGLGPLSPALHWYSEDGAMVLVGINPVQRGRANVPFGYDMDLAMVPVDGAVPVRIPIDRRRWQFEGPVARDDRALLQPGPTHFRLLARDKLTGEDVVLTVDWTNREARVAWRGRGRLQAIQPAGDGFVGIFEDFRTPPNVFRLSGDLRRFDRLTEIAPEARAAASGTAETFETVIPQHDWTLREVRTAVLLPEGARRGDRLPAVVWFYPGSDLSRELSRFGAPAMGDPAYLLTSRGYAVILTDVAIGPGERRGHVIDEIMDALMPQVRRAADLGYVDISRLAIRGHSFGGFGTVAVVARTNLFRAAIPSAGVYDLGGSYGELNYIRDVPVDRSFWSEASQPRLGQSPWDDPLRYIENSPYYLADRIRTPMLIIQGTDDFTGSRESGKLFAALRRLDRPVELALYAGGGHTPASFAVAQAVDQMTRTIEFLRRHIGPGWSPRHVDDVADR